MWHYDGSQHHEATGYHLCQVTAANLEHNKIVPLYCEAFSSKEKDYVVQKAFILSKPFLESPLSIICNGRWYF